jgi:anti-sigma regulatory factor (Ser/Thr protein kinase)
MAKAGIEQPPSLNGQLQLELLPQLTEIRRLAKAIEEFGEKFGFSSVAIQQVTLALDELVTNIVHHGMQDRAAGAIVIDFRYDAPMLTVTVSDSGRPFDPREVSQLDRKSTLDEHPIGGLGVHLIRSLMDSIDYRHESGQNHVTLVKRIEGRGE